MEGRGDSRGGREGGGRLRKDSTERGRATNLV